MTKGVCELRVTEEQLLRLKSHQAVALTVYTREDGSEYSRIDAMGLLDEVDAVSRTPRICLLLPGIVSVRGEAVLVSELINPLEGAK